MWSEAPPNGLTAILIRMVLAPRRHLSIRNIVHIAPRCPPILVLHILSVFTNFSNPGAIDHTRGGRGRRPPPPPVWSNTLACSAWVLTGFPFHNYPVHILQQSRLRQHRLQQNSLLPSGSRLWPCTRKLVLLEFSCHRYKKQD